MQAKLDIPGIETPLWLSLHTDGDECVSRQIRQYGIWEAYETALLLEYLPPGGTFLDVGANIGYYSVVAATVAGPAGRVIAYEPEAGNFRLLKKNLALNGIENVLAVPAAVSDHNGRAEIYLSKDNQGDHQLYDNGRARCRQNVRVLDAGEHVAGLTRHLDFVKLDTQGSEFGIVKSLWPVLWQNRSHLTMVVELWPHGLRQAGASGQALLDLLGRLALPWYIIDHISHGLWPVDPPDLAEWVAKTEAQRGNQGFMNILVGGPRARTLKHGRTTENAHSDL